MTFFSKEKFFSLPKKRQHKQAAELLKLAIIKDPKRLEDYARLASWMDLSLPDSLDAFHDRYYLHMEEAMIPMQTHADPFENRSIDPLSKVTYFPVTIYLDNLRSAFNVGNILRTMEAFRIKSAFFNKNTPFVDHPKVQETAMGCAHLIDAHRNEALLPRPWIALECTKEAVDIQTFSFPKTFTLILGNEALGISQQVLAQVDFIVKIPLAGAKNSLNVSSAFSIAAYEIAKQLT
ncbi:MAG: TrmH family RNA methyltransferase [Chlamydiae bacterium]|jgi:tRNA G18 (ribose-2'-O)-methylase SpoU|nr:TrmH family RNA methyltransferase [Chlamydiota bacterium]